RRRLSSAGKNDPVRTLGIFTVRSPAVVVTALSRVPLRCVVRASLRSCGPAPIWAVASASTSSCKIVPSSRRISSPASALRIISTNSSRADWSRAIALILFCEFLGGFSQSLTRWPLNVGDRHEHGHDQEPELHHPRGLTLAQ